MLSLASRDTAQPHTGATLCRMRNLANRALRIYRISMRRAHRGAGSAGPGNVVETTVFRSGNSDAIRLPKRFAFAGKRVRLRHLPDGRLLVEPLRPRHWPRGFLESFGRVTADFDAPARPAVDAAAEKRARRLFDDE